MEPMYTAPGDDFKMHFFGQPAPRRLEMAAREGEGLCATVSCQCQLNVR